MKDRVVLADDRRGEEVRVGCQRADPQFAGLHPNVGQLGKLVDIDQRLWCGQPQLHHRDEAVPTGYYAGIGTVLVE
jgi:hypothetical protein